MERSVLPNVLFGPKLPGRNWGTAMAMPGEKS